MYLSLCQCVDHIVTLVAEEDLYTSVNIKGLIVPFLALSKQS